MVALDNKMLNEGISEFLRTKIVRAFIYFDSEDVIIQ